MEFFPAVVIGGPPHSGKSVLTYSLTQALRARGIDHYVLRAYPDGEGDWANEADQALVRRIRLKGSGTPEWINRICRDITNRHLPLIVDVGGRPSLDQERVFDVCTHAILLTPAPEAQTDWRTLMDRHNLPLLADLTSQLSGPDQLIAQTPIVRGIIAGLERGQQASGLVFDTVIDQLAGLFAWDSTALRRYHCDHAPVETVIDLDRRGRTLGIEFRSERAYWHPGDLPRLLDDLPEAKLLALYGRAPNWLYAGVACQTYPASFYQFDVRLGWVQARPLRLGIPLPDTPVRFQIEQSTNRVRVTGILPDAYVEYDDLDGVATPLVSPGLGVILDGKIPHWLYTALALTYRSAPWLAVHQPQLRSESGQDRTLTGEAVIVRSSDTRFVVGTVIPMA